MQLFADTKIDFMRISRPCFAGSLVLVAASIVVLAVNGLNMGIEFKGGTEIQVRYASAPDLGAIRSALGAAGLGNNLVTTIGDPADHEIYIRLAAGSAVAEDPTEQVLAALHGGGGSSAVDLNVADVATVTDLLRGSPGLSPDDAGRIAAALLAARREQAIFRSFDDLGAIPGMMPAALDALRAKATVGPLALRSQSFIGPAVGKELKEKALLAILGSLAGMLVYIGVRFRFQWGIAAVVALVHDTFVTLAVFSIADQEMSLPVVAAFLTLVGYSVNDTVVVFDRIREVLRNHPSRDLSAAINEAINGTLSRTTITSFLTWIVVLALFLFGGAALRPFSFVLVFGIIVGTYSSIYVASPLLVLWEEWVARRKGTAKPAGGAAKPAPGQRRARKVRSSV